MVSKGYFFLYKRFLNTLKGFLKYSHISDYNFTFAPCATDLIKRLFKKYVDDDTLVLTTTCEHPNVLEILKKYKNVKYVMEGQRLKDFKLTKQYKRIFVYMIGTICATGYIVLDQEFDLIINEAKQHSKEVITVIDAVQELFLLPRDYSRFDYIIGTAHALIKNYDTGILLSKKSDIGKHLYTAKPFTTILTNLLKRNVYLNEFHTLMRMEFGMTKYMNFRIQSGVNHLLLLSSPTGLFQPIESGSVIPVGNEGEIGVLFRGCWSITEPRSFIRLLEQTKNLIEFSEGL